MAGFANSMDAAAPQVRHQTALDLYREWFDQHEEQRAFAQQAEIIEYGRKLNAFIDKAEQGLAAIQSQLLSSWRFNDSMGAVKALIEHAKKKRAFFDGRYVELGRQSNTFAIKMTFDEQRMVPQFRDLGDVRRKMDQMDMLTPSQAWALVAAETKGELTCQANIERALRRLTELNDKWKTNYGLRDLWDTFDYMRTRTSLASNYHLADIPTNVKRNDSGFGADQEARKAKGEVPLYELMMQTGFKVVWETGISQASANLGERGAVEEQMGYGTALRRTAGTPQDFVGASGSKFAPTNAGEMPRYAATIDPVQKRGVGLRYGSSYIVWKDEVRQRATWTPGDSWSMGAQGPQSVKNFVSINHPEMIFVHAEEALLHLFMAEATGKETAWLAEQKKTLEISDVGGAYIETQIHGSLTWTDVGQVVIDGALPDARQIMTRFDRFKAQKGLNFTLRAHPAIG
jgi:hypothetical protein